MNSIKNKPSILRRDVFVCLFLIMITLAVYWQVRNHEFINLDDSEYVTENRHVQNGLTLNSMIWAFTTTQVANWHPLTWLSHMLDCQLYGLNPKGHHLTNVFLHLLNTLLLFFILQRMTGALWRSGFVAALFALHPLHVESVAWVAERKDVLSTLFWLLTMWGYIWYVERPRLTRYLLTLLAFTLGLMTKPMLVTMPCVLLLLDYWPLKRFQLRQPGGDTPATTGTFEEQGAPFLRLLLEKTPFFALTAASSIVTFLAQRSGGAMSTLDVYPVKIRIGNGLVSYVSYIGQMVWPRGLAVFYPHPGTRLPGWHAVGAGLLLACISIAVIRAARRHPYLAVGWLWYLGTLVPVIGLVQVGAQAMADRYTYVPLIGLFVIIAWSIPDLLAGNHYRKIVLSMAVGTVLLALTVSSWLQVQHWKNNLTLFKHALKVTAKNYVAHDSLGNALAQQGKVEEAIDHYYEALKIKPNLVNLHNNLGVALLEQRKVKEAMSHYDIALRLNADYAETYNNFGVAWFTVGEFDKAIAHYHEALRLDPAYGKAHNNMGNALVEHGRFEEAILHYSKALETKVHYPEAHNNLGVALAQQGKLNEAIVQFKEALLLKPDYTQARANLDLALALVGEATDAPKSISAPLK
jgi:Flp pilus assembly protein TadD